MTQLTLPFARRVRLVITLRDCKEASYIATLDCPLARAVNRQLKKEYRAEVGGWGAVNIIPKNEPYKHLHRVQVPNFSGFTVMNATADFHRFVEIPDKFLR